MILVTAAAIICANSSLHEYYDLLLNSSLGFVWREYTFQKTLLHWVNEGLMAVFFYAVVCEIRQSFHSGVLAQKGQALLPFGAAICGVLCPGLIFYLFNKNSGVSLEGWAIPTATDIAFSLALLYVLSRSVPERLRLSLLAIAVIDDLIAVIIIALFYTSSLAPILIALALIPILLMALLRWLNNQYMPYYILCTLVLWLLVLKSGVHATLAGVIMALLVPYNIAEKSVHALEKLNLFVIMPVFAFMNAGFSLSVLSFDILHNPLFWGIFLGLVVGKPLGICSVYLVSQRYWYNKDGLNKYEIALLGALCGVGFTMSLFIGTLAFSDDPVMYSDVMRFGVVVASVVAVVMAGIVIKLRGKA